MSKLHFSQIHIVLCLLVFTILSSGCQPQQEIPSEEALEESADRTLYVHGAASTQAALNEALELFKKSHSTRIAGNYASSAALAQQILQGSPADVFLSASLEWVEMLEKENLIARRRDLLGNRLVLIVPVDSKLKLSNFKDLRTTEVIHLSLADPDNVPAGKYAQQALEKGGLWNTVSDRIVRGSDVRQALAFVEQGEAEAGIVYATDAAASNAVRVAYEIPTSLSEPIVYPLALIQPDPAAENSPAAEELFEFLCSPEAGEIFKKHGFEPLPSE